VIRSARHLGEAPAPASGYRLDVVAITFDPEGHVEPELVHIPHAFDVTS
jgi:hypothetical protein